MLYRWNDPRLRWNPEDYDGQAVLRVPASEIWLPDLIPYNSIKGASSRLFDWQSTINAVVTANGTVSNASH